MTDGDGLHEDMRYSPPQPGFRSDPLALDEGTAERLLAGGLDPADAPPQYMRAAMVLRAIAAPPSSEELADEAAAIARLVAVARSSPHRAARRRPPVLTKFIAVKLAAAAIAALSLAGVAGAATGTLPAPAQRVAHRMLGAVPSPDDHASTTHGPGQGDHRPTGPDATGAAKAGLCRAWQAGQGGQNGGKEESTAFKALAAAAGGSDKIADYCKDVTAGNGQKGSGVGNGAPPSTLPEQSQGHGAGQGAGNGQGQGSGGGNGDANGQGQGQGQGQGSPPPSQPHPND
jgi:hypothetical protein